MRKLLEGQTALVIGSAVVGARIKAALAIEGAHVVDDVVVKSSEQTTWRLDEFDIVVDVGGDFASRPLLSIDDHEWRTVFDENVLQGVHAVGNAVPGMIMRDRGVVIFVVANKAPQTPWNYVPQQMASGARVALANALASSITNSKVVFTTFIADGGAFSESEFIDFVVDLAKRS